MTHNVKIPLQTNVVLLSTLIAILTKTYDDLQANAKTVWAWNRFDIVLEGRYIYDTIVGP